MRVRVRVYCAVFDDVLRRQKEAATMPIVSGISVFAVFLQLLLQASGEFICLLNSFNDASTQFVANLNLILPTLWTLIKNELPLNRFFYNDVIRGSKFMLWIENWYNYWNFNCRAVKSRKIEININIIQDRATKKIINIRVF